MTARQMQAGEDVPIRAVIETMESDGRVLPEDEFNVDLSRILDAARSSGPVRVVVSNTRDTKRGILLYGMERAGYIGYLRIEGATL